jgi:hypothetical protein
MSTTPTQNPATQAPPPPPAIPQLAGGDLASMQTQLADLNIQLAGLRAEWNGLQSQLGSMLKTNPARPAVQAKTADAGVQIAQVEGKIAELRIRIAQKQGIPVPGTTTPPPAPFRRGADPDLVIGLSFTLALCVCIPLAIGYARRLWRGKPEPRVARPDDLAPRLDRLEQAVDAVAIEIERIAEGQRFVTKILAERPPQAATPAAPAAQPQGSSMPDARPPLALGAGPMEQPINVQERQPVRRAGL